jgi:hypothetical protein
MLELLPARLLARVPRVERERENHREELKRSVTRDDEQRFGCSLFADRAPFLRRQHVPEHRAPVYHHAGISALLLVRFVASSRRRRFGRFPGHVHDLAVDGDPGVWRPLRALPVAQPFLAVGPE